MTKGLLAMALVFVAAASGGAWRGQAMAGARGVPLGAGSSAGPESPGSEYVRFAVARSHEAVPPGQPLRFVLAMDIAEGWHVYWPGQNDSGMDMSIEWKLPEGWKASPIEYPIPARHVGEGEILDYIIEGKQAISVTITAPKDAKIDPDVKVPIAGTLKYLICNESCLPGEFAFSTTVSIREKHVQTEANEFEQIKRAFELAPSRQPLPSELFEVTSKEVQGIAGANVQIVAKDSGVTGLEFYPLSRASKLLDPIASGKGAMVGGKAALDLRFEPSATGKVSINGLVAFTKDNRRQAYWFKRASRPSATDERARTDVSEPQPLAEPKK
jgi:DsbC/DsbD-like thiol-disulfide interchange protein